MRKNTIRLTESQLHTIIKESVNRVLNEVSTSTLKNAFIKTGKDLDNADTWKDKDLVNKRRRQMGKFHDELKGRSQEFAQESNYPIEIHGGKLEGKYSLKDFTNGDMSHYVNGYSEMSANPKFADSPCVGYPKIKGYVGPMYDGGKITYTTQEIYDFLSR